VSATFIPVTKRNTGSWESSPKIVPGATVFGGGGPPLEAAFKDAKTGEIYRSGMFHNPDALPSHLLADGMGLRVLQGFVNEKGKFIQRNQLPFDGHTNPRKVFNSEGRQSSGGDWDESKHPRDDNGKWTDK
jgi:hypothetical protein